MKSTEDGYGSFHRCYRRKDTGELIAFTLIDIVPTGVNSQYFVWNQRYKPMSLGIFSVLDELNMTRQRAADFQVDPFYYFGRVTVFLEHSVDV
jgi:arginyl-tRNA--protein-N-Asp/Glu arginylyltransferase